MDIIPSLMAFRQRPLIAHRAKPMDEEICAFQNAQKCSNGTGWQLRRDQTDVVNGATQALGTTPSSIKRRLRMQTAVRRVPQVGRPKLDQKRPLKADGLSRKLWEKQKPIYTTSGSVVLGVSMYPRRSNLPSKACPTFPKDLGAGQREGGGAKSAPLLCPDPTSSHSPAVQRLQSGSAVRYRAKSNSRTCMRLR